MSAILKPSGHPRSKYENGKPLSKYTGIAIILIYIALFFSVLSGIIYLVKNKDAFLGKKSDK